MKEKKPVRQSSKRLQVAASPFNPIKFWLGVFLVAAMLLVFALSLTELATMSQLIICLAYSVLAALFLCFKIRRVSNEAT